MYWCTVCVSTALCSHRPRWKTTRTHRPWLAHRPGGQTVTHSPHPALHTDCRHSERTSAAKDDRTVQYPQERVRRTWRHLAESTASTTSSECTLSVTNIQMSHHRRPKPQCRPLTIDKHVPLLLPPKFYNQSRAVEPATGATQWPKWRHRLQARLGGATAIAMVVTPGVNNINPAAEERRSRAGVGEEEEPRVMWLSLRSLTTRRRETGECNRPPSLHLPVLPSQLN